MSSVYVTGTVSDNAFKITPGGAITEIIGPTGDGTGNGLGGPRGIAVDTAGNAYVAGSGSDNAFRISGVAAVVPPPAVPALSNPGLARLGVSVVCAAGWLRRRQRTANA